MATKRMPSTHNTAAANGQPVNGQPPEASANDFDFGANIPPPENQPP